MDRAPVSEAGNPGSNPGEGTTRSLNVRLAVDERITAHYAKSSLSNSQRDEDNPQVWFEYGVYCGCMKVIVRVLRR